MASLNQCNFIGNVGKVDSRFTQNGEAVTNISIAINETWKDKSGIKQERTEWVNVVFYRKLAEIVSEHIKVGSSIFVSGRLQTRKWQDKDGNDRYSTEIIANQMQMLGSRSDSNDTESAPQQASNPPSVDDFDSDLPF